MSGGATCYKENQSQEKKRERVGWEEELLQIGDQGKSL